LVASPLPAYTGKTNPQLPFEIQSKYQPFKASHWTRTFMAMGMHF